MADLDQLYTALRNADAAGDADGARKLAAHIKTLQAQPAPADPAAPGERNLTSLITGKPATLSTADKLLKGLRDPLDGGAQLLTHLLPDSVVQGGNRLNNWLADKTGLVGRLPEGGVDQQLRQAEQSYQARRAAGGESGIDGYRALGGFIPSAAITAATGGAGAGLGLAGRVSLGAAQGAVSGALAPAAGEDPYWTEKAKQVALGAGVGGAVPAVFGAAARVVSPNASRNANLQMLKDEGVRPTIGQALGGRWNALEEKMQSTPILGDAIAAARGRSLEGFNRAAINRAAGKVGAQVDKTGHAGVAEAGDAISQAYGQFNRNLMQLRGMAQGLTTDMKGKFNRTINETLMRKVSRNGSILPDDFKAIDSELGNLAGRYGKSQVASEQELGDAVKELRSLLQQQMARSNPQVADELKAADAGWANLVRVEGAARTGKNNEGLFTPGQLNSAIQMADQSVRKRAVSRGTALMQDLGNAGQSVLGNRVPNSGTPERLLYAGGALGSGLVNPAIPASLLAGAGLYLSPAQRLLLSAASSRPAAAQPAAESLRNAGPMLIPGLTQFLLNNGGQ
jgi:hypothetical protein